MKSIRFFVLITTLPIAEVVGGCAQLHHAQFGDIDARAGSETPFEVKVSETGVSTYEAGAIARGFARNSAQSARIGDAQLALELFQMGPRTGNPVWDQSYAENMIDLIHEQCPTGDVTGLMLVRETRKYPVISGEIVKVAGYCKNQKSAEKNL